MPPAKRPRASVESPRAYLTNNHGATMQAGPSQPRDSAPKKRGRPSKKDAKALKDDQVGSPSLAYASHNHGQQHQIAQQQQPVQQQHLHQHNAYASHLRTDGNDAYDDVKIDEVQAQDDDMTPPSGFNPLIFQCRKCCRLLGDSTHFISTDPELGYVTLSKVTEIVSQATHFETSLYDTTSKDLGSTFAKLFCKGCSKYLGKTYKTTPRELDDLRGFFSFQVDNIFTYQIGSTEDCGQLELLGPDEEEEDHQESDQQKQEDDKRPNGNSHLHGSDPRYLESKLEKTRTFAIQLSERLIRAEETIRSQGELLARLLPSDSGAAVAARTRTETVHDGGASSPNHVTGQTRLPFKSVNSPATVAGNGSDASTRPPLSVSETDLHKGNGLHSITKSAPGAEDPTPTLEAEDGEVEARV